MKVKAFTHTDTDGVGCAVLAYLAFGHENVDVEFCDYKDIDEKVVEFVENDKSFSSYDRVFITDISVSEGTASLINMKDAPPRKIRLFDHHPTALWLNKHEWCEVLIEDGTGIKTSGTALFYNYLVRNGFFDCYIMNNRIINNICRFVEIVRDYDTWRWNEIGDEGIVSKQLNDVFEILGRDMFIEWVIGSIRADGENFPYFDGVISELLYQRQKDIDKYVEEKSESLMVQVDKYGHEYGAVFADRYFSELGNRLCELHDEIEYVAMIDISKGRVHFRTTSEELILCDEIAHSFNGGGHRKAAGGRFDGKGAADLIVSELFKGRWMV